MSILDYTLSESTTISDQFEIDIARLLESNLILPSLELEADGIISEIGNLSLDLPVFILTAEGIVNPTGEASLILPIGSVSVEGRIDEVGNLDLTLPGFSLQGNGNATIIGNLSVSLPRLILVTAGEDLVSGNIAIIVPNLGLAATGVSGALGEAAVSLPSFSFSGSGISSIEGDLAVTLPSIKLIAEVLSDSYLNMVMNLKNYGLSLYTNYKFNSMCRFNGIPLGATKTKIYNLNSGTTDDGTDIDWNIRLPYLNLELKTKKRLRQAKLEFKSSGDIIVTVIYPDGTEYEYDLIGYEVTEGGVRVKFGKGIYSHKSQYVALDFKSKDGSTVDLDVIGLFFDQF
jgi:hypothetical protein